MCTITEPTMSPTRSPRHGSTRAAGQAQLAEEETPEYQAYLAELDAQERRARERSGKPAPMAWGTDLGGDHYFCTACWYAGFEDGAHSHEHPPCDKHPRPFRPPIVPFNQGEPVTTDMIIGRWYQIRHRSETQQYDRVSVMQYLGVAERPGPVTHRFSARPVAGTQTMPHSWLISVAEVPATTTPIVGTRWQPTGSARALSRQPQRRRS